MVEQIIWLDDGTIWIAGNAGRCIIIQHGGIDGMGTVGQFVLC